MKRKKFIQLTGFALATICFTPFRMFGQTQSYTKDQLTGRGGLSLTAGKTPMQPPVFEAFERMKKAALGAGIEIGVVSAYRSYKQQSGIWARKYRQFTADGLSPLQAIDKIITYSSMPGASRHHWGTDLDLIDTAAPRPEGDVLLTEYFHGNGPFCKFKDWMDERAESFGFYLTYTDDPKRPGYNYEPWHYSYAPISRPMLEAYQKLNLLDVLLSSNLPGSEHFSREFIEGYIKDYVLGVNPDLI